MSDPLDKLTGSGRGLEPIIENAKRVFKMDPEDRGGSDYPGGGPGFASKEESGEGDGEAPPSAARKIPDEVHDDVTLSESAKTILAQLAGDATPVTPVASSGDSSPPAAEDASLPETAPTVQHINLTA